MAPKSPPPSQHDMTGKRGRGSWVIDTRCDGQVVAFFRYLETNEHSKSRYAVMKGKEDSEDSKWLLQLHEYKNHLVIQFYS